MKIVETRTNDDEVSGVYLLDDGRQVFWTEGRSSDVRILDQNGDLTIISNSSNDPFLQELLKAEEDMGEFRPMTPIEMAIYDTVRNFNPNAADEADIEEHLKFTL